MKGCGTETQHVAPNVGSNHSGPGIPHTPHRQPLRVVGSVKEKEDEGGQMVPGEGVSQVAKGRRERERERGIQTKITDTNLIKRRIALTNKI